MKIISVVLVSMACAFSSLLAQDAATEERLNRLSGQIEDILASQKSLQKQLQELSREIQQLRDQADRPNSAYASVNDLNRLSEGVKQVDQKRIADMETIRSEIKKLGNLLASPPSQPRKAPQTSTPKIEEKPSLPEKYFRHKVGEGETLSAIIQAYRQQNVSVTLEQILKANPGLKPERLVVGKEIIIPAP